MDTHCVFLCGLNSLFVKADLKDGFLLIPNEKSLPFVPSIRLTNNKKSIQKYLTPQLANLIGLVEYHQLLENYPLVAIAENKFNIETTTSIAHLDIHLYYLKMYFFCLWLVKDNSADFDIGFLCFTNKMGHFETSSNNFTSTSFTSRGTREKIEFSIEELAKAAEFFKDSVYTEIEERPKLAIASAYSRLTIANHFILHARTCSDLGLKVANYCSFLEALFTNDNTELSHKLSERVAKYLEEDIEKRIALYRRVKKIYEIRSKVVHGASFKMSKAKELEEIVERCDEVCRKVMAGIFSSDEKDNIFDKSQEQMEEFFLSLILK